MELGADGPSNGQSSRISRGSNGAVTVMRELPVFEAEKAQLLQYDDTPAIITDSRLDLLSRLPPKRCAVETVQYLKGTHPDFRAPSNGAAPAPLAQRLAEASPVGLEIVDGALEATNPGAPERVAPRELAQRVDALRTHVAMLIDCHIPAGSKAVF